MFDTRLGSAHASASSAPPRDERHWAPESAPGSGPVDEEHKVQAKEALNRLLIDRKKELLKLQMQAKEKQLAALRGRLQERKAPAVVDAPAEEDGIAASVAESRQPERRSDNAVRLEQPLEVRNSKEQPLSRQEKLQEQKDKLAAAMAHRRLKGTGALQAVRISHEEAFDEEHGQVRGRLLPAKDVTDAYRKSKRRRNQPAEVIRSVSPHSVSPRSRSRSAGGASEDSEVQKRWRAQEAIWRRELSASEAGKSR